MKFHLSAVFSTTLLFFAGVGIAFAAPLNFQTAESIQIISPATTLIIATSSVADALQINATSVALTLSTTTGGSFTLISPSYDLSIATSSSGGTIVTSCISGVASTTISQASGSTIYTITPDGSTCANGGPPTINSFTANPSSITDGDSSVLSWSITAASTTTLDNGIGDVSNQTSVTVNPSQTTTYTLTVTNSVGSSTTAQATVTVTPAGSGGGGSSGGGGGGGGYLYPPATGGGGATTSTVASGSLVSLLALLQELRSLTIQLFNLSNTNNRALSIGSKGVDVWALQILLIIDDSGPRAGKLAAVGPTGYFGVLTQGAVAEYQAANGIIPVAGYFGPKTKASILGGNQNSVSAPAPTPPPTPPPTSASSVSSTGPFTEDLYFGISNAQVSILQKFLAKDPIIYPQGLVTGYYGAATAQAVQRFQLDHAIPVSQENYGVVDAVTRSALNALYLAGQTP